MSKCLYDLKVMCVLSVPLMARSRIVTVCLSIQIGPDITELIREEWEYIYIPTMEYCERVCDVLYYIYLILILFLLCKHWQMGKF